MATQTDNTSLASLLPEILQFNDVDPLTGKYSRSALVSLLNIIEPLFSNYESVLDDISAYFDPLLTSEEFLPWLASWTALVLRADWSPEQKRKVLAQIIPLYRKRGTRAGLEEYLKIYVGEGVSIFDEHAPLQVGTTSTVGVDTVIGGLPPHFFHVNVAYQNPDPGELSKITESVRAVLDIEKPAHTFYALSISGPTFQIGVHSTVGIDTLI